MDENKLSLLENQEFIVNIEDAGTRLDKYLALNMPDVSRNYIQDLIKEGYVFVNDKNEKPSYKIENNDQIIIYFKENEDLEITAQNIPLDIIYQDENYAIINKAPGMVVHISPGHNKDTLVNAILYHIKDLSGINGVNRPGIVHRIDKDTSGLIVIAKNDNSHRFLQDLLKNHEIKRTYICLCRGIFESRKGIIKTLIGRDPKNRLKMAVVNENGKEAITEFEVLKTFNDKYSLVKCNLQTGRTHQIRVHMNFIKHPIINDPLYGDNNKIDYDCKQLLHAYNLEFISPTTNKLVSYSCDLPKYFKEVLDKLENGNK